MNGVRRSARRALAAGRACGRARPEPTEHLGPGRPLPGMAAEQVHAERAKILGRLRVKLPRRRRVRRELLADLPQRRPDERPPARQRLVEHHPHGVPVGRLGQGLTERLLGRHVAERAGDLARVRLGSVVRRRLVGVGVRCVDEGRGGELGDQTEVEKDDAALPRHHHIRRLEVAVELAGGMERLDALGQLPDRRAEPFDVEHSRRLAIGGSPAGQCRVAVRFLGPLVRGPPGRRKRIRRICGQFDLLRPLRVRLRGRGFIPDRGGRLILDGRLFSGLREPGTDVREEVGAVDPLHREEPAAGFAAELI